MGQGCGVGLERGEQVLAELLLLHVALVVPGEVEEIGRASCRERVYSNV